MPDVGKKSVSISLDNGKEFRIVREKGKIELFVGDGSRYAFLGCLSVVEFWRAMTGLWRMK